MASARVNETDCASVRVIGCVSGCANGDGVDCDSDCGCASASRTTSDCVNASYASEIGSASMNEIGAPEAATAAAEEEAGEEERRSVRSSFAASAIARPSDGEAVE